MRKLYDLFLCSLSQLHELFVVEPVIIIANQSVANFPIENKPLHNISFLFVSYILLP